MSTSQQKTSDRQKYNRPVTDEAILKVAKEVAVKFIEVGRLTPSNFADTFCEIHKTVYDTVRS